MRECDNSKMHISNNSLLSICLLIMLDTLFLVPSLYCNTLLHLTTLHQTTPHYTYRHFTCSHLRFTTLPFGLAHLHFLSFYFTSHHVIAFSEVQQKQQICFKKLGARAQYQSSPWLVRMSWRVHRISSSWRVLVLVLLTNQTLLASM